MKRSIPTLLCAALLTGPAHAQSLFQDEEAAVVDEAAKKNPAAPLVGVSLYAIQPPEPRTFQVNDLITVIVNEQTTMEREQTLEADKKYDFTAARVQVPEAINFLLLNGNPANVANLDEMEVGSRTKFDGEGTYEREDHIRARFTARVLEVKPNGSLLLEARSSVKTDEENQTFLLSGICRTEDVTEKNTIESSQLFDLHFEVKHSGEIRRVSKKGLFPRFLETLFNF